jgi:hypothetical protein
MYIYHPRQLDDLLLTQSVLIRGLTAYNHNLDTSREYYPKVDISEYTQASGGLMLSGFAGHHYKDVR